MPDKLTKQGKSEVEVLHLVNKVGQVKAATLLNISPAMLNRWLKRRNYVRVTRYEKATEEREAV